MQKIETPIGYLKNNWRRRMVTVYPCPDKNFVRTFGVPFDGGRPVETIEPRKDWERVIALFPKTAVYE